MTTLERDNARATSGGFLDDVAILRERALAIVNGRPASDGEGLERELDLLNLALAMELAFVLRYKRHFFTADRLNAQSAADEFLLDAAEESEHADRLAARIRQLGGEADLYPEVLTGRGRVEFDSLSDLEEMVLEDVAANRVAMSAYREMIEWIGEGDATTRRTLEEILATEEERAKDIRDVFMGMTR